MISIDSGGIVSIKMSYLIYVIKNKIHIAIIIKISIRCTI